MIYQFFNGNYHEDPIRYLSFLTNNDVDFFYGIGAHKKSKLIPRDKKRILLTFERSHDFDELENDFDEVLLIHKFYDEWHEKVKTTNTTWKYVYYPLPIEIATSKVDFKNKQFDVVYAGLGFQGNLGELVLNPIFDFNYAYVSMSQDSRVTHYNVNYHQKLETLRKSKVSIVHNIILEQPQNSGCIVMKDYISRNLDKAKLNHAWHDGKNFRKSHPELKSRIFEAAASGCIPLVMKDDFLSVEKFFEPNIDFLYFEQGNLKEVLKNVLDNYEDYKHLAYSAKKKCELYTDKQFSIDYIK